MKESESMTRYIVNIPSVEEASVFSARIQKMPFDVDLHSGRTVIDAKSVLGLIYFGVGRNAFLEAHTDRKADQEMLEEAVRDYLVQDDQMVRVI